MADLRRPYSPLSYLAANAAERGSRTAVFDQDRNVTFAELNHLVHGLMDGLVESGLTEGEPVGVRLPNIWEYVALEIAIPAAGGVVMPLPLTLGDAELRWAIEKSGARRIIDERALTPLFLGAADRSAPAAAGAGKGIPASLIDPSRIVEIALTSGTTGLPKLAALSARLKQATFEGFTSRLEVNQDDRVLVMSPLTQGIGGMCLYCLRLGAGLIMLHQPRFTPEAVLRLADRHAATILVGVPTNVMRLLECPALPATDLSALRLTAVAGAPLLPDAAAQWEHSSGAKVCLFYGSMDAGQLSVGSPSDPREKRHHTVGKPHSCCEVMITAQGEICMRGETVQERYWGEDHGPHSADGWVHMGDLGELDADGYLKVTGRSKDLIIRGGTNINPHEVEGYLRRHASIADACVVGRPDRDLGERPVAFVVVAGHQPEPDLEVVRRFLDAQGLSRYKWPEEVRVVAEIPLSGPGKVNRRALQEQLLT